MDDTWTIPTSTSTPRRGPKDYYSQTVSIVHGRSHPVVTNIRAQACGCNPSGFSGAATVQPSQRPVAGLNSGMGQSYLANRLIVQFGTYIPAAYTRTEATGSFGIRATRAMRTSFTPFSFNPNTHLFRCHPTPAASRSSNTNASTTPQCTPVRGDIISPSKLGTPESADE